MVTSRGCDVFSWTDSLTGIIWFPESSIKYRGSWLKGIPKSPYKSRPTWPCLIDWVETVTRSNIFCGDPQKKKVQVKYDRRDHHPSSTLFLLSETEVYGPRAQLVPYNPNTFVVHRRSLKTSPSERSGKGEDTSLTIKESPSTCTSVYSSRNSSYNTRASAWWNPVMKHLLVLYSFTR